MPKGLRGTDGQCNGDWVLLKMDNLPCAGIKALPGSQVTEALLERLYFK